MPSNAKLLFTHESASIREIVKATMCFSNNFLAERLGDMLGGPYAVARIVQLNAAFRLRNFQSRRRAVSDQPCHAECDDEASADPRSDLATYRMTFADIMPVAGMDQGTLENRFDTDFSTGSVIGKTGTLGNTDGGVSALSGEINTRNGTFLFVIFNDAAASHDSGFPEQLRIADPGPARRARPRSPTSRIRSTPGLAQTKFSYPSQGSLSNEYLKPASAGCPAGVSPSADSSPRLLP